MDDAYSILLNLILAIHTDLTFPCPVHTFRSAQNFKNKQPLGSICIVATDIAVFFMEILITNDMLSHTSVSDRYILLVLSTISYK